MINKRNLIKALKYHEVFIPIFREMDRCEFWDRQQNGEREKYAEWLSKKPISIEIAPELKVVLSGITEVPIIHRSQKDFCTIVFYVIIKDVEAIKLKYAPIWATHYDILEALSGKNIELTELYYIPKEISKLINDWSKEQLANVKARKKNYNRLNQELRDEKQGIINDYAKTLKEM